MKIKNNSTTDYFARITAVIGLIVALIAVVIPIWLQSEADQERLNVWMRVNSNGIVLLPDNKTKSSVIQIPWLITLSNTGKVRLSITGYNVFQMENGGLSKFPDMVGLVRNTDGSQVIPPINIDSGESKTIKMHLGFMANSNILDKLYSYHEKSGAFTVNEAFKYLAKDGMTVYGGNASLKKQDGSIHITVDSKFYLHEPVYRLEFKTGRKESFFVQGSETLSRFSN